MVVDIGGGTSEVAVISLGGIVVSSRSASAATRWTMRSSTGARPPQADDRSADRRGGQARGGSATELREEIRTEIRGRDIVSGLPKTVMLSSEEVRTALVDPVNAIVNAVKETLDRTPPELAGDIMDRGITLAGGGSLLQGFDERLRDECQMPAQLADSPLTCVAVGSGRSLEEFETIHRVNANTSRRRRRR